MAECRLVNLWRMETGGIVSDVRQSADGQYLLVRGEDWIAYYNWGPQLLWQGSVGGDLRHVAVSSKRDQVLAASDKAVCSFNTKGDLLWGELTAWKVEALHLNTAAHCIAASKGQLIGCLNERGQPIWQHDLHKTVCSVTVSLDGQRIMASSEDGKITCLDRYGQVIWTCPLDKRAISIGAGGNIVAVGDAGQVVHCLDDNGVELCLYEMRAAIKSVAVNATGKYITVGTERELHQFFFTDAPVLITPIRSKPIGAQSALKQLGADEIQNIFMNHDGGCLLIEGESEQRCYDLEGSLLWSCPKVDMDKFRAEAERLWQERELRRQQEEEKRRQLEQAKKLVEQVLTVERIRQQEEERRWQAIQQIRETFTRHVYTQSSKKAREAQARQNIPLEGEILDLYFDGKGYLFVSEADIETFQRAAKLAKRTNIYIIAYNAPDDIVQMVKRTKGIDLYRLSDMTKTTGWLGGSDFETFMLLQSKTFTKK